MKKNKVQLSYLNIPITLFSQVLLVVFLITIFIMALKYIDDNLCISVIGDEFGYWSAAAALLNKPWHSLASTNNYYGWGYSIILAPIMALFATDSVLMYHASILINALLLCGETIICYQCCLRISKDMNRITCALIAGTTILYSSNLNGMFSTMPEVFISFILWCIVKTVLNLTESNTESSTWKRIGNVFLLSFLLIYSYSTHQRTIGLCVCATIFLLVWLRSRYAELDKKSFIIVGCFLGGLFVLGLIAYVIKKNYATWLYDYTNMGIFTIPNDYGAVLESMDDGRSLIWFKSLCISLLGKLFYANVGTGLLLGVGCIVCIEKVIEDFYIRKCNIYLFVLLTFLQSVCISALFMPGGFEIRTDILIYGRYSEYTYGPLIMIGLLELFEIQLNIKKILLYIIMNLSISLIIAKYIATESINTNMGNIFALSIFFDDQLNREAVFLSAIIAINISLVYLFIRKISERIVIKYLFLCTCLIGNIFLFMHSYERWILPWQTQVNENIHLVEEYQLQRNNQANLYAYNAGIGAKMIQFLMVDEECVLVYDIADIPKDYLVISQYTKDLKNQISEEHNVLYANNILILWRN